jgi:septal ring-binding cell division protein DamX
MKIVRVFLLMLMVSFGFKSLLVRAQEGNAAALPAEPPATSEAKTPAKESQADAQIPAEKNSAAPGGAADGEYEIDYEEEPGTEGDAAEETPVAKPIRGKKTVYAPGGGAGGIMGSRAKHRFTPILKSETRSIYKKDGKSLDVDSD